MALAKPTQITVPFSSNGVKNTIPETATGSNLASMQEGFPVITMTDVDQGGMPPQGQDMNGILFDVTKAIQYQQAGGLFPYDATFAQAIDGYPLGALLTSADGSCLYQNTVSGNVSDPDNGGQGWSQILSSASIAGKQDKLTPVQMDAVNSGITSARVAIYDSYANGKQDALTFDDAPTNGSSNPVTSDGIKTALDGKLDKSGGTLTGRLILGNGIRGIVIQSGADMDDLVPDASGGVNFWYCNSTTTAGTVQNLPASGLFNLTAECPNTNLIRQTVSFPLTGERYSRTRYRGAWSAWLPENIFINVRDYGANGDGITDDTTAIQAAIYAGVDSGKTVFFPAGRYKIDSRLTVTAPDKTIRINADGAEIVSTLDGDFPSGGAVQIKGSLKDSIAFPSAISEGTVSIARNGLNVKAGDLITIQSNQLVRGETRSYWTSGCVIKVLDVDSDNIYLDAPVHKDFLAPAEIDITVTEKIDTEYCKFGDVDAGQYDMRFPIYVKSGANVGKTPSFRYITDWDNTTKIARFRQSSFSASASVNGDQLWAVAPAVGDVFTLKRTVTVSVYSPVKVEISGLKVTRSRVDSSVTGQKMHVGLNLFYSVDSVIENCELSNFVYANLQFVAGYRPTVRNCSSSDCNGSGTGYSYLSAGTYGLRLQNCLSSNSRAGFSTSSANLESVFGEVKGLTVYGGTRIISEEDVQLEYPYGYAWGEHGDGFRMRFDSCVAYNTNIAAAIRGHKGEFLNCIGYGRLQSFTTVNTLAGVSIRRCQLLLDPALTGHHPFFYINNVPSFNDEEIVIEDCYAENVRTAFIASNATTLIEIDNLTVNHNVVKFNSSSERFSGISNITRNASVLTLGGNCCFIGNQTNKEKFLQWKRYFNLQANSYLKTGLKQFFVSVDSGEEVVIPFGVPNFECVKFDVIPAFNDLSNTPLACIGAMLWRNSGKGADYSPLANYNKGDLIYLSSNRTGFKSGYVNFAFLNNEGLIVQNSLDTVVNLIVSIDGVE